MPTRVSLPPQADYFPIENNRYEVKAGLKILGKQPVEGRIETHFYLIDDHYFDYLAVKREARQENLSKYYVTANLAPELAWEATAFVLSRMSDEYPAYFQWDGQVFVNRLLGMTANLDGRAYQVTEVAWEEAPFFPDGFQDPFDLAACQLQEDLSIISLDPANGRNWLSAIHLCFPGHWSPQEKIGRDFMVVHAPVADIERVNATADKLVDAIIHKGPFIRFVWGIDTDNHLNHHPDNHWLPSRQLPHYDPQYVGEHTYFRVERQTLKGFPKFHAGLFTIRPYYYPVTELARDAYKRAVLEEALRFMTPEQLAYKGMTQTRDPLVTYLASQAG